MTIMPDGLNHKGMAYWNEMVGKYSFTETELMILENICKEIDLIEHMNNAIDPDQLRLQGVRGAEIADPLLGEIKQHRNLINTMVKSLHLPADAEHVSEVRKAAVNARWSKAG